MIESRSLPVIIVIALVIVIGMPQAFPSRRMCTWARSDTATELGFKGQFNEVAPFHRLALGNRFESGFLVVEVVHQALASEAVVVKSLIEISLFEDHAIMDAGDVITSCTRPCRTLR